MNTTRFKASKTEGNQVQPVPKGYHTLTPGLTVRDARQAIDFYRRAFGAQEQYRMAGPDGRVMHAELKIGDSVFMLGEENPAHKDPRTLGGTPVTLNLYVPDADDTFKTAVEAGAKSLQPVEKVFWGDRYGKVEDPDGHVWGLCTRVENLTPEEITKRGEEFLSKLRG